MNANSDMQANSNESSDDDARQPPWETHALSKLAPFSWLLPDMTTLNSPENFHLSQTIKKVLYEQLRREQHPNKVSASVLHTARNLVVLVQWMKLRGIGYFHLLSPRQIEEFLKDCSQGSDVLLQATPRVVLKLRELRKDLTDEQFKALNFRTVLQSSGITLEQARRLDSLASTFREIVATAPNDIPNRPAKVIAVGASYMSTWAYSLSLLLNSDSQLADALQVDFDVHKIYEIARSFEGKPRKSTRTIPPELAPRLIRTAIRWVLEVGPLILDAFKELNESSTGKRGAYLATRASIAHRLTNEAAIRGWPISFQTDDAAPAEGVTSLNAALWNHLRAACFIVIAIFSGRRGIEVESLEGDCLLGTPETGLWIHSHIGKRNMSDKTPCPSLVAVAVETLRQLNPQRIKKGARFRIFSLERAFSEKSTKDKVFRREHIQQFAELEGLTVYSTDSGQANWRYLVHQFRRIFALTYFWRYDDPALLALAHHFRHMNMNMIRAYVRDLEMQRLTHDEAKRFTVEKLQAIATGKVAAYGIFGKSVNSAIDRLRREVEITDKKGLKRRLIRLVEHRSLSLNPTPWGCCGAKGNPSNIRRAVCQKDGAPKQVDVFTGAPDSAQSSEEMCSKCLFHLTDDSRKEHWERLVFSLKSSIEASGSDSVLGKALEVQRTTIESFVRNNFGNGVNSA